MASDSAVVEVPQPKPLESLSPGQYQKYRMTGEVPAEGTKEETTAAVEPEKKQEPAAKPAPETVTEAKSEPKKVTKLGYSDLRNKVREQEAEIERLKSASTREEPRTEEPAKARAEAKEDARPKQNDKNEDGTPKFKDWTEYEDALLAWNRRQSLAEFEQLSAKKQQEQEIIRENRKVETSWKERVDAAKAKHDDFDAALDPKEGPAAEINSGSFLDRWILDSDEGAELLYYFHGHRGELKRIGALSITGASRELTRLEMKLSGKSSEMAPPAQPDKRETKAPPPTREVGGRGTATVDEVNKAVADDDVRAYINSANRAEIARKKR